MGDMMEWRKARGIDLYDPMIQITCGNTDFVLLANGNEYGFSIPGEALDYILQALGIEPGNIDYEYMGKIGRTQLKHERFYITKELGNLDLWGCKITMIEAIASNNFIEFKLHVKNEKDEEWIDSYSYSGAYTVFWED